MDRSTDKERVYNLICSHPGYQVTWYAWILAGGIIENGQPVGYIEASFPTMQKMLKVQQRINELVKTRRVIMGSPKGRVRTQGMGVFPAHTVKRDIPQEQKKQAGTPKNDFVSIKRVLGG